MRGRLLAIVEACREDWRLTRGGTKVVLILLPALVVAWLAFAIWFSHFEF